MKHIFIYILLLGSLSSIGQVVISSDNTATLDASAELRIYTSSSPKKGVLFPQMTAIQMYSISKPDTALLIYNTTDKSFQVFGGTTWDRLGKTTVYTTATAPATGVYLGEIYYNSDTNILYFWNGASWIALTYTGTKF